MTRARFILIVALIAALGVSLDVTFLLRDAPREAEEPDAAGPVETATAPPVAVEIDSIDQIVDLLESQPRVGGETKRIYSPTYIPGGLAPNTSTTFSEPYFGSHYSNNDRFLHLIIAREPFYHIRLR